MDLGNYNWLTFIDDFLSSQECDIISQYIIDNENMVKSIGPDIYPKTSDDSLTGRYSVFNYLYYPPGKILIPKLKNIFGDCLVQCWANIFRIGEGIEEHFHSTRPNNESKFLVANLFLSGPEDIGTTYNGCNIKNKKGTLSIFMSDYWHSVPKNTTFQNRISMAFNIYQKFQFLNTPVSDRYATIDEMIKCHPKRYYMIS